ncbi:apolipoprotein C-I [Seriola aureovittata]|uniref:Apolipoprotein C-I n=1 Tax=Seriola lalandi dorsalis TaxID=1841481 RepID=A0A3B4WGB2_SERLL|nr:apolipoprotein C-I [Seriola aureovittata]
MKLYLAVAVLVLAFVAYTAAEAQEDTIEQRFTKFGEQMTEMGRSLAEKAKTSFEGFQSSDIAVSSKNWFQEQLESIKAKFEEITQ